MITIGIDASTNKTGYAIFENNELYKYGAIEIDDKNKPWRERVIYMINQLAFFINKYKVEQICVEVPVKTLANVNTLEQLFSLHGAILGMGSALNCKIIPVEVAEWRKELGIAKGIEKGKDHRAVLKERSIKLANQLYGLNLVWKSPSSKFNEDDISDAILITHSVLHKDDVGFGIR